MVKIDNRINEDFIRNHCIIDDKDNVHHLKESITQTKGLFKVKNLLNPKYGHWELVTKIIRLYLQNYSASSNCPVAYNNLLLLKAIITDRVSILDLEIWEQRFKSKFPNLIIDK